MNPWDGHSSPVVDSPGLRNERVVLPVVAVKRVSLSQPRLSPLDRDVSRKVISQYVSGTVGVLGLVVAACKVKHISFQVHDVLNNLTKTASDIVVVELIELSLVKPGSSFNSIIIVEPSAVDK